jgi:hypothetical protein
MNYQELVSLVGGSNPQAASYQDIVSGIQSQYRPQTQFAPTTSLLDMIGNQLPEQPRIAYGSLLQAQPRVLPTPMTPVKNTDATASLDSGQINLGNLDTGKITGNTAIDNTLVYNNDFTKNIGANIGNITAGDVAKVGGVVAPIAALAGNSDLVKTAVALNLIASAADIKTEQDVINLGTRMALLAAGPSGNLLAAGLGLATNNTPMTANALLGLVNPTLGIINSIASNLTDYSFGDIVNGLLNTPEGTVSEYGLLGAANLANTADASRRRAGDAFDSLDANQQRVLSELYDSYQRDANRGGFDLTGSYDFRSGSGGGKLVDDNSQIQYAY